MRRRTTPARIMSPAQGRGGLLHAFPQSQTVMHMPPPTPLSQGSQEVLPTLVGTAAPVRHPGPPHCGPGAPPLVPSAALSQISRSRSMAIHGVAVPPQAPPAPRQGQVRSKGGHLPSAGLFVRASRAWLWRGCQAPPPSGCKFMHQSRIHPSVVDDECGHDVAAFVSDHLTALWSSALCLAAPADRPGVDGCGGRVACAFCMRVSAGAGMIAAVMLKRVPPWTLSDAYCSPCGCGTGLAKGTSV